MKPKLVHFIFNLGRGGAETLVVNVCNSMKEYDHTIITLFDVNHFKEELKNVTYISMHLKLRDLLLLPFVLQKFKKLIQQIQPDIVHAHLLWPVSIARLALPANIPLVTTIHGYVSQLVDYKKWYFRWLDKYTFRKRKSTVIAVSKGALKEYVDFLGKEPNQKHVLYTFADTDKFKPQGDKVKNETLRLVSVGALRYQKNQGMMIEMMALLKNHPITLDIYGRGDLEETLKQRIKETGAKVALKGQVSNLEKILPQYDAMIMSSHYEGFSIGVLEAMAMQLPLILSDIPSFREQCGEHAFYFALNDVKGGADQILKFMEEPEKAKNNALACYQSVFENFTKEQHLKSLSQIYQQAKNG